MYGPSSSSKYSSSSSARRRSSGSAGYSCGFGMKALELRDDARGVADPAAVEYEHGQRVATAKSPCRAAMEAGVQRAPRVGNALIVERPAHLLVVVRDLEMPEDRQSLIHGVQND